MNVALPAPLVHVVDDDDAVRAALVLLIEAQGWQVRGFTSVAAWLEREDRALPQCLVLDVELDEPDGALLQECLHADPQVPPVVVLTSVPRGQPARRARGAGARCVLTKPQGVDRLVGEIGRALPPP